MTTFASQPEAVPPIDPATMSELQAYWEAENYASFYDRFKVEEPRLLGHRVLHIDSWDRSTHLFAEQRPGSVPERSHRLRDSNGNPFHKLVYNPQDFQVATVGAEGSWNWQVTEAYGEHEGWLNGIDLSYTPALETMYLRLSSQSGRGALKISRDGGERFMLFTNFRGQQVKGWILDALISRRERAAVLQPLDLPDNEIPEQRKEVA